ncbi:MAG: ATP-binding protein, partial [Anaerolineales bacterium]
MTATNSLETALPAAQAAWGGDPYPANGRAPAAPTPPEAAIHAHLQGEVSGQVAVGNYIVQIGRNEGGVVNVALGQPALPRALPTPVLLRPDPFLDLLDREVEVNTVLAAVRSTRRIEFYGQPGLGKTALLRHLGHHALTQAFPDGVLSLQARRKPLADLLQSLFDAFYERDPDFKPTDVQIRRALQGKRAIIFLDDVEWEREDVEALIEAAPDCTFLLAAPKRHWWGEGRALALHGLPLDESLKLMERELGRPLKPEERPVAQVLCTQME